MAMKINEGDMFACRKCAAQIQVMNGCDCRRECADFRCCGEPMKNITEPTIRAAGDQSIDDGFESEKDVDRGPSMAEQAEAAKKI